MSRTETARLRRARAAAVDRALARIRLGLIAFAPVLMILTMVGDS